MRAAEHLAAGFDAVAQDAAAAVRAGRRELLHRAFKAVEGMGGARDGDAHRLVVIVAARFAAWHVDSPGYAARRLFGARFVFGCFFSTLFLRSCMRSITSAPFSGRRSFSGSVISSVSPAFTFSSMRFMRSWR